MKKICSMTSILKKIIRNSLVLKQVLIIQTLLGIALLLSACGEQEASPTPDYFIPPTLSPERSSPTPLETPTQTPLPTEEEPCENNLAFVDDVTIPDDTIVAPGQEIEKIWLVENNGTCNWEIDYTLRMVDGLAMGASSIQALRPTVSGKQVEISILFTAPTDAGRAFSQWQAHDPEGNPFGDEFFVQVIVDLNFNPENGDT